MPKSPVDLARPIFIVGMPRSGTTLLKTLLSRHPDIAIAPETYFLCIWARWYAHASFATPKQRDRSVRLLCSSKRYKHMNLPADFCDRMLEHNISDWQSCCRAFLDTYARLHGKRRIGEKTPDHYRFLPRLFSWFPNAHVLFMVRDPRAVICSLQEAPWARSSVKRYANRWCACMAHLHRYADDARVHTVQYEDLVAHPQQVLTNICEALNERFAPSMLETREERQWEEAQTNGSIEQWRTLHKQRTQGPIVQQRAERWKTCLSASDVTQIESIAGPAMEKMGYAPATATPATPPRLQESLRASLCDAYNNMFMDELWFHARHITASWCETQLRNAVQKTASPLGKG